MHHLFSQIAGILGVTVGVALIGKLFRQPIIVAYILAGIAVGPIAFNLVGRGQELFDVFSQLGVILLLFVVGLSLNFSYIKKIGKSAIIGGISQVVFTSIIGALILISLGFNLVPAIYVAVAITFSSTIIITKLLSDKKHTDSLYGRHTVGLMLIQDVVAIVFMIVLTANSLDGDIYFSFLKLFAGVQILFLGVFLFSKYVLPVILKNIADSTEFLFLFALTWCFVLANIADFLGFSMEIGAVVAGITLGSSVYRSEISARITPLRDFFLIIFFIILGAEMNFENLGQALIPGIVLTIFILVGNPIILYSVYRKMKFNRRNSVLIGITAGQVSEFGFVLLFVARELGYVGDSEIATFTLVALGTIFVSSYLITYNEKIFQFIEPFLSKISKEKYHQIEETPKIYDTWIVGYHRIGWNIVQALKEKHGSFAVIDFDPTVIEMLKNDNVPSYFLDVADVGLLSELPLEKSKLVISTIPNIENQITLIKHVRNHNKDAVVVANAPEAKYLKPLYEAGADYVMTPHLLGGKWIGHLISVEKAGKKEFEIMRHNQEREINSGLPVHIL